MNLSATEAVRALEPRLRQGRLSVFAGSGISVPKPSSLPTWDDFILKFIEFCEDMNRELRDAQLKRLLGVARKTRAKYPRQVVSALRTQLLTHRSDPRIAVEKAFAKWFDKAVTAQPNANHLEIVRTNFRYIITTNYDSLLEDAAVEIGFNSSLCE